MKIPVLPNTLQTIANAAVAHAHGNGPLPKSLSKLLCWLEGPGWNDLMGSWVDERMALKLQERPSGFFCDSELRAFEGLDDTDVISDEARVSYARERISEWAEGEDGYLCPSVHCFPIGGLWGRSAVVGYLVEIHGQGGPVPVYCGIFLDNKSFYSHLRGIGLVLCNEVGDISDDAILRLWEHPC